MKIQKENKSFQRVCKRCDKIFYTNARGGQFCEKCNKGSNKKKNFARLNKTKSYECFVCGKIFESNQRPIIPFCSDECRSYCKKDIKSTEDALKHEYDAHCIGGMI